MNVSYSENCLRIQIYTPSASVSVSSTVTLDTHTLQFILTQSHIYRAAAIITQKSTK